VKGLDGRFIPLRKEHAALNTMIQSSGAILCKRWLSDARDECLSRWKEGADFSFVAFVHDEVQVMCRTELADEVGAILVRAAHNAGNDYGFRMKLDCEYSVGDSWAETH
jgi:DNA polymerase I-like protein with 3'-5' exonuclease and polymerase domains